MAFGRAHVAAGNCYINEPGNPEPAKFFSEENLTITNGMWVSFDRDPDDPGFAINIVQAPETDALVELVAPAQGLTAAAEALVRKRAFEHLTGSHKGRGTGLAATRKATNAEWERFRDMLAQPDERVGVAAVRQALTRLDDPGA